MGPVIRGRYIITAAHGGCLIAGEERRTGRKIYFLSSHQKRAAPNRGSSYDDRPFYLLILTFPVVQHFYPFRIEMIDDFAVSDVHFLDLFHIVLI